MISGLRFDLRGAQTLWGAVPDLATFGKAMGNGFSVSALCGRSEIMRLGGLDHDRERVFLLSATHGGETHALAAALTAIDEMEKHDVAGHVRRLGARLMAGIRAAAADAGLQGLVDCIGQEPSPVIVCRDRDGRASPALRTLFLQEMVARGVLIPYIAISLAHGENEIDAAVTATRGSLEVYARALDDGVGGYLRGPVVKPVFRRYN